MIGSGVALTNNSEIPLEFEIGLIKKILKDSIGLKSKIKKINEPKNSVKNTATKGDK